MRSSTCVMLLVAASLLPVALCGAGSFRPTKLGAAKPVRYLKSTSDEVTLQASLKRNPSGTGFLLQKGTMDTNAVAWGEHRDAVQTIGFGVMSIHSNPNFDAESQMFAAGYLEGYLTNDRIRQMFKNARELRNLQLLDKVYGYCEVQDKYLREQARKLGGTDKYWNHVGLVLRQLDGLVQGYNDHALEGEKLTAGDLWLLNMDGDVLDVERAFEGGHAKPNVITGNLPPVGEQMRFKESVAATLSSAISTDGEDSDLDRVSDENLVESQERAHRRATSRARAKTRRYDEGEWNRLLERGMGMRFKERVASIYAARTNNNNNQNQNQNQKQAALRRNLLAASTKKNPALQKQQQKQRVFDEAEWKEQVQHTRCSAVVTLAEDNSDFFLGHTTWSDYSELLRLYKHYDLPVGGGDGSVSRRQSFSSYPGMISSTDDWYHVSGSNLMIIETTMNIENEELYEKLDPGSQVVSWVRTLVANRIAKSGKDWAAIYTEHNSGTYNCMWLIFDLNKFSADGDSKGPQPGFFTMTEQIPGMIETADMTDALKQRRYFPSVNRPYFAKIREAAGYPADNPSVSGNDFFSFEDNPRGREFKQRHHLVKTIDDLGALMRYNGYSDDSSKSDPTQLGKPGHAIAARFDEPGEPGRRPVGATDSKITDYRMAMKMESKVLTGPTTENGQPPFKWSDSPDFGSVLHEGVNECYDFQWQTMSPFKSIADTGPSGFKPGSACNNK